MSVLLKKFFLQIFSSQQAEKTTLIWHIYFVNEYGRIILCYLHSNRWSLFPWSLVSNPGFNWSKYNQPKLVKQRTFPDRSYAHDFGLMIGTSSWICLTVNIGSNQGQTVVELMSNFGRRVFLLKFGWNILSVLVKHQ